MLPHEFHFLPDHSKNWEAKGLQLLKENLRTGCYRFFPCLDLLCLLVGSFWLMWFGVCFCIYPGTSFVSEQGSKPY